jgi:hypothetical protein
MATFAFTALVPFQHCGKYKAQDSSQSFSSSSSASGGAPSPDLAMTIYQRLGTKTSIENPQIMQMTGLIAAGDKKAAAELAAKNDQFFNVVIRDFAMKMSNREQSVNAPLNDFAATVIGIARDGRDAREMLTGNYFYYAPTGFTNTNIDTHVVRSNAHYQELETKRANLAKVLVKKDGQMIVGPAGTVIAMEDPAGVITSRAFLAAHAIAGTNRRLVEFSFSQFLCTTIDKWSDTKIPDGFVGRDIGRQPADLYKGRCVGCHAPMDALRPAFAHLDFKPLASGGYAQYKLVTNSDPAANNPPGTSNAVPAAERTVPSKFRRNKVIFADGYAVSDDNWENYTSAKFGWRTAMRGKGLKDFGKMLADSRAFSECMVRRAYKTVCYTELPQERQDLLYDLTERFETGGYKLASLFADIVSQPECTGAE